MIEFATQYESSFFLGHDFSRADKASRINRALGSPSNVRNCSDACPPKTYAQSRKPAPSKSTSWERSMSRQETHSLLISRTGSSQLSPPVGALRVKTSCHASNQISRRTHEHENDPNSIRTPHLGCGSGRHPGLGPGPSGPGSSRQPRIQAARRMEVGLDRKSTRLN